MKDRLGIIREEMESVDTSTMLGQIRYLDLCNQHRWELSRRLDCLVENLPRKSKTMAEVVRENKKRYNQ